MVLCGLSSAIPSSCETCWPHDLRSLAYVHNGMSTTSTFKLPPIPKQLFTGPLSHEFPESDSLFNVYSFCVISKAQWTILNPPILSQPPSQHLPPSGRASPRRISSVYRNYAPPKTVPREKKMAYLRESSIYLPNYGSCSHQSRRWRVFIGVLGMCST